LPFSKSRKTKLPRTILLVGCKRCPAFLFCLLTIILGNQLEKDKVDSSNGVSKWTEENLEDKSSVANDHFDKMDDHEKKNEEVREQ
jgi:hypothetical protein